MSVNADDAQSQHRCMLRKVWHPSLLWAMTGYADVASMIGTAPTIAGMSAIASILDHSVLYKTNSSLTVYLSSF
jgi:hypothetical protein